MKKSVLAVGLVAALILSLGVALVTSMRTKVGHHSAQKDVSFNPSDYVFEVLGGPAYSPSQRPPSWRNEIPLPINGMDRGNPPAMENLPFADFPLIEDFEVRLEDMKTQGRSVFGYQVRFFSRTRGYIADFPWWDHPERNLIRDDFQIPMGDLQKPFYDDDQGWEIIIFADADLVYVLQGHHDYPAGEGYYAWFKVIQGTYLAKWQDAIALCRKTFSR